MRIYLCRVRERNDGTLYIERNSAASVSDDYIAISHVWGAPDTIQAVKVEGMEEPVSLSPGKIPILDILRRSDVCGSAWFWMDLFCLDQTPNAAISMADQLASIPKIYKRSRCVKVLIESPVCRKWMAQAVQAAAAPGGPDEDTFVQFELHHARKCRFMLFADPWFERLWTRQEGLYANQIQTKWISEGINADHRYAVQAFIYDKLQYLGHIKPHSSLSFRLYLDLVYRGKLDMKNYPSPQKSLYSPIDSAWRSGRKTTKARDYVLAVFPDLEGYTVPPDARNLSFATLMHDALQQLPHLAFSLRSAVKVTQGTLETRGQNKNKNSLLPFLSQAPANITEAYDTFSLIPRVPDAQDLATQTTQRVQTLTCNNQALHIVAQNLSITPPSLTRETLPALVSLWETTASTSTHLLQCPLSSPCTGTNRALTSQQDFYHRAFAFAFTKAPLAQWAADGGAPLGVPHGVVDERKLVGVCEAEYTRYLERFLVCLMCGVTLSNALRILDCAALGMVRTAGGRSLLALVNREWLGGGVAPERFLLLSLGLTEFEGFHVGVRSLDGDGVCVVVGRTWIPGVESDFFG
ncbi:hypothetical protein BDW02DRAFT_499409 [Decorospora gaudefroyi]|uniref:Heterokaryon incompatibility domain-containing protein n=1 Tax=Decorospora gaudefroyi TaxID=184978 RepID=A0A6A5KEV3_9PLEO|nr:hypothetical protein BDW02DRAFT_499409 [Decorospora gaudefroyi]